MARFVLRRRDRERRPDGEVYRLNDYYLIDSDDMGTTFVKAEEVPELRAILDEIEADAKGEEA